MKRIRLAGILAAALLVLASSARAGQPAFKATGPEPAVYGEGNYPVGDRQTWRDYPNRVGSFSHFERIFPVNRAQASPTPWAFRRAEREPEIHYEFRGQRLSLEHYLASFAVTGLVVLQGDTILLERYQYGRTDQDRFTGHSMAKSILAFLAGIAQGEGRFRSLDDPASDYVPALKGTLYGETSLRVLLQMSSGVLFDEKGVKPPNPDTTRLLEGLFSPGADAMAFLAGFNRRAAPAGTLFHYSSGDNETVGLAIRGVTGRTLTRYLEEKLWHPIGAEGDATWVCDTSGQEYPFYGFNAVLRDYARLGRLLAHDGNWNGKQIIPREFLLEATTFRPSDRHLLPGAPSPYYGYGYQTWIFPGERRMFLLRGAYSQYVFVDPQSKLVMAQTGVRSEGPDSENGKSECMAFWLGLVRELGGEAR